METGASPTVPTTGVSTCPSRRLRVLWVLKYVWGMARPSSFVPDVTVPATHVGTKTGRVLDQAIRQPVGVTKHGRVRFVIQSIESYEATQRRLAVNEDARRAYTAEKTPDELAASIEAAFAAWEAERDGGA